ncbi:MAG: hypothetical protein QNJ12_15145 [Ilumatobacter sp.]|uniref:hypothetical protein n=1 Tax=Ilumatobacter sp. TaxID=1967498 RepID=UPI002605766B|nr:hypothetical protein [Ilumatobacter sp.]MDJ0770136.1 hypothetical protein [Ilumatobacter sp.]
MRIRRDHGTVLPLVLVIVVVLSLVVISVAKYSAATLRQGQVVEASADRLAAADGATDNALEAIDRGSSPCTITALGASGYTYPLGDTVNDIDPSITCQVVGGQVNAVDSFAVIITGDGGQTGPLLEITNGGSSPQAQKVFEGPVYLARTPRANAPNQTMDFSATLTLKDGDLWYSNPTCPATDVDLPTQLTITPAGYTTKCLTDDWFTLFGSRKPPVPAVAALTPQASTTPTPDANGCYIWPAGRYSSPPQLANQSYNYFESGDYFFDDIGTWQLANTFVLAGYPGSIGPGIPGYKNSDTYATNPCRNAWNSAADQSGAAFFMGGTSNIDLTNNSALEISGRAQGAYNVGLQALDAADAGALASTITGDGRIVLSNSGTNKQLSIQGLVWAPQAGLEFDLIANDAVAALTGGAVVAELSAGASAQANNFVIRVDTQPSTANVELTVTATKEGTTKVRTLITYRTDTEYAVLSRRVTEITPE